MATTERVLALLGLFQSRPVWTAPELADRLTVTERTIRRDVERLRGLGYAIDADRGPAGGYRLHRGSVLPPLVLTDEEAVAVALCLRTAGLNGLVGEQAADPALRAATKLEGVLPSAARARVRSLAAAIAPRGPVAPGGQEVGTEVDTELLTRLAEAVARRHRVHLRYPDRHGASTERHLEPHRLLAWRRHWYLSAYDLERDDWRTFRLDRMTDLHVTTLVYRPRAGAPEAARQLAQRDPGTFRHRVVVVVDAPAEALAGYAPYLDVEPLDAHRTRLVGGAEDADRAAIWVLQIEQPCQVVGDDAVVAAVHRLRGRLTAMLSERPAAP